MELYLIRHGIAAERGTYANDDDRPLTEAGIRKTKQVAKRIHDLEVRFDLIQTSPLPRARQTAEILQAAQLSDHLSESPYLAPAGDFAAWLKWLQHWRTEGTRLAIVGHEPDVGEWAERLIWGEPRQHLIVKKASIMGLLLPEGSPVGRSQLFWLAPPRFMVGK